MTVRKERRDAAEHRRLILQKAKALFAEYGVEKVSMHQIARSIGIGQGTLYRRYAHKGDLCLDILHESYREFNTTTERYLNENKSLPVRDRLEKVLVSWLDYIDEKTNWLGIIQPGNCEESFFYSTPLYMSIHRTICVLLEEALRLPDFPPVDPAYAADAILISTSPILHAHLRKDRGYTKEQITQYMLELFVYPLFRS